MTYAKSFAEWNTEQQEVFNNCCSSPNIVQENGFYVCSNCGMIISRIVKQYTKSNYSKYEKNDRRQSEKVLSPFGPRTIFKSYKDGKGNELSPDSFNRYQRLGKINRGLRTSMERNLWIALPKLQILQKKLNLPSHAFKEAYKIYKLVVNMKLTLGRGIENLLAASFYTAIKIYEIPRTFEEICQAAQITRKDLIRCYKVINEEILPIIDLQPKLLTSKDFLIRFSKDLDLPIKIQKKALRLIRECIKRGMRTSGKDPKGFAGAAIYICAKRLNEHRTQKEISETLMISEVTLRSRIKELKSYL